MWYLTYDPKRLHTSTRSLEVLTGLRHPFPAPPETIRFHFDPSTLRKSQFRHQQLHPPRLYLRLILLNLMKTSISVHQLRYLYTGSSALVSAIEPFLSLPTPFWTGSLFYFPTTWPSSCLERNRYPIGIIG